SAVVYLAFDNTDFDADSTHFSITILAVELTGGTDLSSNKITIAAIIEPVSLLITPNLALDEMNLDGSLLYINLTNETFVDNSLEVGNFTLNNAPVGTTISNVVYVDPDSAVVYLAFDNTDFDADSTHFSITILAVELTGGADLTSNELTITAIIEPPSLMIVPDMALEETTLDNRTITAILSNEVFVDNILDIANFSINNAPSGVAILSVNYNTVNSSTVVLSFDGTDFDIDSIHFSLTIDGAELNSGNPLTSNEITISAYVEPVVVTISPDIALTENNLYDRYLNISIENDYFIDNSLTNFDLMNFPTGTSVDSIIYQDSLNAVIYLAFDSTDFDTDSIHCLVSIDGNELFSGIAAISNEITVTANTESPMLSVTPDTTLIEDQLNGRILTLGLTYETFADSTLDSLNFTINDAPAGVSLGIIEYVDSITSIVHLVFDLTDFDEDSLNVSITIDGSELTTGNNVTSELFTIYTIDEELIQAIMDAIDSTTVTLPVSVIEAIGNPVTIDIEVNYPDTFNTLLTSDYLVDALISFSDTLVNGVSIIVEYNSAIVDTFNATGIETEFWLSSVTGLPKPVLADETDCIWTFTINNLPEGIQNMNFELFTALINDFYDLNKRYLLDDDSTEITVFEPITINTDPQSQTECSTYSVTFSVDASSNSNLQYQWRKNSIDISGANTNIYTIPAVSLSDAGAYSCVISNSYNSETSANATLTVLVSPNIGLQDVINITTDHIIILGVTAGYSSYLWNTSETNSFISVDGSALGVGSYIYWVSVTDDGNGCSIVDSTTVNVGYSLIVENNDDNIISIFPNPANDKLYINNLSNSIIELIDIQ
ncbi:MAG: immunoglobulin domain-containing protein, partial [Bacteroidota bacterium]